MCNTFYTTMEKVSEALTEINDVYFSAVFLVENLLAES